jgi:hypothetical protein
VLIIPVFLKGEAKQTEAKDGNGSGKSKEASEPKESKDTSKHSNKSD